MSSTERLRDDIARPDWGPWLVTVILLAGSVGYARATAPQERLVRAFDGHVLLRLPPGWSAHEEGDRPLFVAQRPSPGGIAPTVLVEPVAPHDAGGTDALFRDLEVARMQEARASEGAGYRVLHVDERRPDNGPQSTWIWYAIVRDPPTAAPGAAVLPRVVVGVDVLVLTEAGAAWHVAAFQPAEGDEGNEEATLRRVVEGLRFP